MSSDDYQHNWRQIASRHSGPNPDHASLGQQNSLPVGEDELRKILEQLSKSKTVNPWIPSAVTAILLIAAFAIYLFVIQPRHLPVPIPNEVIPAIVVEQSMHDWMNDLSSIFEGASQKAAAGNWENDSAFAREFEQRLTRSRQQHFEPINQMIDSNLSGELWSNERASALFSEIAKGFKEVSK